MQVTIVYHCYCARNVWQLLCQTIWPGFFCSPSPNLGHCAEDGVVTANTGSILLVGGFCVTSLVEFWHCGKHAAAEPNGIPLHMMRNYWHINRLRLEQFDKKSTIASYSFSRIQFRECLSLQLIKCSVFLGLVGCLKKSCSIYSIY